MFFGIMLFIFVVVCILLCLLILIQSDKGGGISGAIGGGLAGGLEAERRRFDVVTAAALAVEHAAPVDADAAACGPFETGDAAQRPGRGAVRVGVA